MLSKSEKNYSITKRGGLAVVLAINKWRVYLLGSQIKIKVDHQPLLGLFKKLEATSKVARWLVILSEYNITWEFRRGRKHQNPEGLSRAKYAASTSTTPQPNDELLSCLRAQVYMAVTTKYFECKCTKLIVEYPPGYHQQKQKLSKQAQRFELDEGNLLYLDVNLS